MADHRRGQSQLRRAGLVGGACAILVPTLLAGGTAAASQTRATFSPTGLTRGAAAVPVSPKGDWITYGGAETRDSVQPDSASLRAIRLRWRSPKLDGPVYGEPLVYASRVEVATEANTVYALSASTGKLLWSRHLGVAVPASALPCGDISPTVGVTSTMVIDPSTGDLFVSAALMQGSTIHHQVIGLSAATGKVLWRRDVDRPGWDAAAQLQRTGLALAAGRVVVGFGGNYGDCGNYTGVVVGVPESGTGAIASYKVPTSREGAVWAPSGVSANAAGDVFFTTGNGAAKSASAFDEGDSVVELSPSFGRIGYFAPANWLQDNESDGDLGSTAPMLLPGGRALQVGKDGTAYLINTAQLGGIGHQLASAPACSSYGGGAYLAPFAYVACPGGTLEALRVGARSLIVAWKGPNGTGGSPTVAGGMVWEVDGGHLVGLSPKTGAQLASIATEPTEHFAAPSAGEGLLVVGTQSSVEAFEGAAGWRP